MAPPQVVILGYLQDVGCKQVIEVVYHLLMAAWVFIAQGWKEAEVPPVALWEIQAVVL